MKAPDLVLPGVGVAGFEPTASSSRSNNNSALTWEGYRKPFSVSSLTRRVGPTKRPEPSRELKGLSHGSFIPRRGRCAPIVLSG